MQIMTTKQILAEMDLKLKDKNRTIVRQLCKDIETAYLNSEIGRMYGRLEKSARDIADVSHKLTGLKKRYKIAEKN